MPVGNVLVRDPRGDVEHDNTTLAIDVVTISQATEFFLTCSVPDVELDLAEVLKGCQTQMWVRKRFGEPTVVKPRG